MEQKNAKIIQMKKDMKVNKNLEITILLLKIVNF